MKSHVNKELLNTTHEIECPECQKKRKIKFKMARANVNIAIQQLI